LQHTDKTVAGPPSSRDILGNFLGLMIIAGLILGADQFTKYLVVQNLGPNESWSPVPALSRLIKITYIYNSGAAFGMFQNSGNIFVVVALIVAVGIVIYYVVGIVAHQSFQTPRYWLIRLSLGLQLGGALGNMIDRLRFEEGVIDFVDIGFWPIFNVADVSIVTGVIILTYILWKEDSEEPTPATT
jgi:signal peptidase II